MDYNSTDVRLAISSNCESFTVAGRAAVGQAPFVWPSVFSIDGRFILQSTPSRFNSTFFSEVPSMSALQQAAACAWAQSQIIAQAQRSSTSVDQDTLSIWAQMAPGFPNNPNHGGGVASTGSHGGGVQIGQGHNLPPPPPHPMYAGFANAWRHPAPITPQERKSFAFGRTGASPINLAPNFLSPSMLSGAASQQLSGGAASHLSPVGAASQPAGAASQPFGFGAASQAATFQSPVGAASQPAGAASQPFGNGAASHFPHLSALLATQTNQPPSLANQTNHQPPVSAVPSQFNSIAQTGLQALPLHPAQFGLQSKVLRPWDIEALNRPAPEQDPNMMRGFTRTNIATLVAAAKAKRIAQGPDATRNTIVEKVVWPEMKSFTEEDFMRTRKLFHAATNASFTSCIFKEFKDCMLISCAQACRRKFHLDTDALWLSCDDAKLQLWLAELFGPKSKEDAIRRLEAVKLAPHSDAQDSQSTFVSKLNSCATDFNFVINDIADTHQSWSNDNSLLSTGELTFKEVMDIWRKKFNKQDRSVFSVQIKECRDFMDRSKELEFNDIVLMLTNHFTSIDDSVSSGKTAYTTTPSQKRREDVPPPRAAALPSPRGGSARPSPLSSLGKRDSSSRDSPRAGPVTVAKGKYPRKTVPGHMRGIACGNTNNHFGLGCSPTTCAVWGTSYDKNKNGHVWQDSIAEPTVIMPKPEYDAILKNKPGILLKWANAKDAYFKNKFDAKVSALQAGDAVSDSEVDPDDVAAGIDEFGQADESNNSEPDTDEVNDGQCVVSALAVTSLPTLSSAAKQAQRTLSANKMKQFFGVSRVQVNEKQQSVHVKTLMDPGAEYNIVSPAVRDQCVLQTLPVRVAFFQGRKRQCVIDELSLIRFELENSHGVFIRHAEWCAVADLGYDLLLGRKFCQDNGFTLFHTLLKEWQTPSDSEPSLTVSDIASDDRSSAIRDSFMTASNHVSSLRAAVSSSVPTGIPTTARRRPFVPHVSPDNQVLLRFTRKNVRGRSSMLVAVDAQAAHNTIDKALIHDDACDSAIKQLERKNCGGVPMVLLEFSLETWAAADSKLRLREWFRIEERPANQVTIRGHFDPRRLSESAALHATSPTSRSFPKRDHAPSREVLSLCPESSRDDKDRLAARKNAFEREAQRSPGDCRFVSLHPTTHRPIRRNADHPMRPEDRHHLSFLGNFSSARHKHSDAFLAALSAAQEASLIARSQKTLRDMIKLLPENLQEAELAAVAASRRAAAKTNFEVELDNINRDNLQAQLADLAVGDSADRVAKPSWSGDPRFVAGCYVEISDAKTTTELNGRRVRLYEKSDASLVWIIRVLGKNSGLWKCHERFLKPLPALEQAKSRPSSHEAGFLDVAIDETGQPTGDLPSIVHRQFGSEYSKELTAKIEQLKSRYPAVFTKDVSEPCAFEKMKIRLIPNAILPSKSRFYRNTPKMKEEVRRQIQEQLSWGAIRRAETAHCSDILLVKKPHMPGQWRFVVNFQRLNDATVPEQLIMPDPANQHARLAGCRIFGAVDMSSYFRQLELEYDSQYLTGFATDEGTYVHTRVPMGIKNAPAFAQRVLQDALANDPVLGRLGVKNYFDDVPFGAKTEDEFLEVMEAMLEFCSKWKLKINPEKCIFGVTSITHVGFIVSEYGVSIDPERSRDIADLQSPKSIKKVQSVLGVMNYVRNFIPNFSALAKHLTDKLSAAPPTSKSHLANPKPAPPFVWTTEDQTQFDALKAAVLQAPLLAQLDYSKQIFIRCDASRFGAGAVLFQYDEQGREHVACYASRKFLPAETRWSTFQQEASTVVWALERFREFTQGYHVVVECDHRNISFVKRSSMPQLARWRMRLQDHDFEIRFLAGALNQTADGLSRVHVDDVEVSLADAMPECSLLYAKPSTSEDFAQVSAFEIAPYRLRSARGPAAPIANAAVPEEDAISSSSDDDSSDDSDDQSADGDAMINFGPNGELLNSDGVADIVAEDQPTHITAPFVSVSAELGAVHNDLVGHAGVYVTLQRLLRNGRAWASRKQMLAEVDAFIQGCPVCQKLKKRRRSVVVDRHTIAGSPFAELSIDVLKLPEPDVRGNKYCVVIVDNFSHWVSLTACVNKSAFDAARALIQFIGNFGAPLRLRSDGGKEFVNGVITGVTRMMGISPVVVQPYTPTANGIVERANRAILERAREMCMCKRLAKHTAHQWGDLLPLIQRALNASVHSAIGTSPSRILFGECIDLDRSVLTKIPDGKTFDMQEYCDVLAFNQRVIIEEADRLQSELCNKIVAKAAAKQRGRPVAEFAVNDWVLVKPQPKFPLHKLAPRWPGPYRIFEVSPTSDKVLLTDTVANKVFSVLKRQIEPFDVSQVSDVAGLTKVAECDNFEFPVEAIMGHAIISQEGVGVNPIQLQQSFIRGVRHKKSFQFLIKWTGYEEATWIKYIDAKKLAQFPGYVSLFPGLNML
jgi:hypothetical protein